MKRAPMDKIEGLVYVYGDYHITENCITHISKKHLHDVAFLEEVLSSEPEQYIHYYEVDEEDKRLRSNNGGYRCSSIILVKGRTWSFAYDECPVTGIKQLVTFYESNSFSRIHRFKNGFGKMVQSVSEILDLSDSVDVLIGRIKGKMSFDNAYNYFAECYAEDILGGL